MAEGWIKLYRNIQEHWIWQDPQKLKWWLDILLLANHKENKFLLGNNLMKLERGEHHTSEVKLSERWKVDRKTVRRFLKLLESDGMIELKKTPRGTTIKVSNYNNYQDFAEDKRTTEGTTKSQPKGQHEGQQSPSQRDTNNNDKNDNNDNNVNKNNYMSDSNEYRLAEYLYKHIRFNNPKAKKPNLQNWAKIFDYILRIDKRDLEEVKQLIVFCQKHSFWYKNILSADKFRKQYDRLLLEKNDNVKHENKVDSFNNYEQRDYDFKELEKKLLGWQEQESEG